MSDILSGPAHGCPMPHTPIPKNYHPPELVMLNASALSSLIHRRAVSCVDVMQAYLRHIAAVNPAVNALVALRNDEVLLKEAQAHDDELAAGRDMGWLHGIPVAIKDLSDSAGLPTSKGSPLFARQIASSDTVFVARMKAAGAIVIGKSNTPEFGLGSHTYNPVHGATRNAYDVHLSAGGSSGGAAAALAMRLLPIADGSDMMGSLRNPAAFNNVLGFRPTFGVVPRPPSAELYVSQLSSAGPMARNVPDLARLLAIQSGHDPRDPLSNMSEPSCFLAPLERKLNELRIGWLGDMQGNLPYQSGIDTLCQQALTEFETLGAHVEETRVEFSFARLWRTWLTLRHWLVSNNLHTLYHHPTKRAQLKPEAIWEIERGLNLDGRAIFEAWEARTQWFAAVERLFERFDVLALPSAQVFPFEAAMSWPAAIGSVGMDTYHRWMSVVVPGTLYGGPVISIPIGFNANGLPMGMQLIGRCQHDFELLQVAHAFEQKTRWSERLPTTLTL